MSDALRRFHFTDSPVRGEICQLDDACREVFQRHAYPLQVRDLLGQALAATALMASSLKFEGCLILQVQGEGAVSLLMAEADHTGALRGIAQYDAERFGDDAPLLPWSELTGNANLILTIDPEEGERYQGIVPLEGERLSDALDHYFAQSEQLPTRFHLATTETRAGGLMLQVLPGHAEGGDDDIWARVNQLAVTASPEELCDLPDETLLFRLYHEEQVEVFEPQALRFHCHCSRERGENALRAIDPAELRQLVDEQGGHLDVDCQFCRAHYRFDRVDIEQLLHHAVEGSPRLQ